MPRVPAIKLFSMSGDFVIVVPGSTADELFRARGYSDEIDKPQRPKNIESDTAKVLFPGKKRGRPKKVKDIGKTYLEG